MPQTAITSNPVVGIAGTFATAEGSNTISLLATETITVGKGVVLTSGSDTHIEEPDATGEVTTGLFQGIALRPPDGGTTYAVGEAVRIATDGTVWVAAEDAVAAGEPVWCRFTDAGSTGLGSFRSDVDTSDAVVLEGAIWRTSTGGAGLAQVRIASPFKKSA